MSRPVYIWAQPDWPHWRFDLPKLALPLERVSREQGRLLGRLADLGFDLRSQASLEALTADAVETSAIEGEHLDVASVRSSLARRLGVDIGALAPVDRDAEGVVEMVLDATTNAEAPLTLERLFAWHAALFPTGHSGVERIRVGALRDGPIHVVSGPIGRRRVHFEGPPAERLPEEMRRFLAWVDGPAPESPVLRAGLGHLYFVTLHPFDDGNGRMARAIGDLLLARAEASPQRFYSLSAEIQRRRKTYYEVLERTQKETLDVTAWLHFFLDALEGAIHHAHQTLDAVVAKARFWSRAAHLPLNQRQIKVLNRLLDGFEGKLTTRKWAALTKCSDDTALRDINALLHHGILRRSAAGGRSTSYELVL